MPLIGIKTSQLLSAAALSFQTSALGQDVALKACRFKFSAVVTQTVTVTLVDADDANYNVVLATQALVGATSYIYIPDDPNGLNLAKNKRIKLECTAAGAPAITVYPEVEYFA